MITIKTICRHCKQNITFKRKHSNQDTPKRKCPKCKEYLYKTMPSDYIINLFKQKEEKDERLQGEKEIIS